MNDALAVVTLEAEVGDQERAAVDAAAREERQHRRRHARICHAKHRQRRTRKRGIVRTDEEHGEQAEAPHFAPRQLHRQSAAHAELSCKSFARIEKPALLFVESSARRVDVHRKQEEKRQEEDHSDRREANNQVLHMANDE